MKTEKRQFIRHPTEIPIEISDIHQFSPKHKRLNNISLGGLAFNSSRNWQLGTLITIRIPLIDPLFKTIGQVVWCKKKLPILRLGLRL